MSAYGTLQVHVYTSRASLPLAEAAVTVTQKDKDGLETLLSMQLTDLDGKTRAIQIEAPERNQSEEPGQSVPFSSVTVTVDLLEYDRTVIENVQIFSGIASLQDVALLPRASLPETGNQLQAYTISPQGL